MTKQISFAASEWAGKKKVTRREKFLGEMEAVVPWERLVGLVEKHYPSGKRGRPPIGAERMLRVYFLQQWYGLADEALEDSIYDSQAMRNFLGIDLSSESVPDATTLLKFRRFLEKHRLTEALFIETGRHLDEAGLRLREGTIVDATIIAAASSTKNQTKSRDPEMHQVRKGNQWFFGMRVHAGADAASGLAHSLSVTAANVGEITQAEALLHGEETSVHTDAGYTGIEKRPEHENRKVDWHVAEKRGRIRAMAESIEKEIYKEWERRKARVRAKVEHLFHIVKTSSIIEKSATGAWPRTAPKSIPSSPWPTWSLPNAPCWRPEANHQPAQHENRGPRPPKATSSRRSTTEPAPHQAPNTGPTIVQYPTKANLPIVQRFPKLLVQGRLNLVVIGSYVDIPSCDSLINLQYTGLYRIYP